MQNGDGCIDYQEFVALAETAAVNHETEHGGKEKVLQRLPPMRDGVTVDDLRKAQKLVKQKIVAKYSDLRSCFKHHESKHSVDNTLSRKELERLLHDLNLEGLIKSETLETLIDFVDIDGESGVQFAEFARVMSAADVMAMAPLKAKFVPHAIG